MVQFRIRFIAVAAFAAAACAVQADRDSRYSVVPLVSDIPGLAPITDPLLVNPWGISVNPTGPFWVSNAGTGTSTLYGGDVSGSPFVKNPLEVTIPGNLPTGQVFNGSSDFVVTSGSSSGPARFIFATITGNIDGWNPAVPPPAPSTMAQVGAHSSGAVYTGLAIGNDGARNLLYAANVVQGTIDVFNGAYQPTTVPGGFANPSSAGMSPFNIQALAGKLYVAYSNELLGDAEGNGLVSEFDMNGHFLRDVAWGDMLNRPWGLQIAPANFGSFSGALIVGNFGDGRIHAFNLANGRQLGALKGRRGGPIEIERLWGLQFGTGVGAGDRNAMYFAAGIRNEEHGLFGKVVVDSSR